MPNINNTVCIHPISSSVHGFFGHDVIRYCQHCGEIVKTPEDGQIKECVEQSNGRICCIDCVSTYTRYCSHCKQYHVRGSWNADRGEVINGTWWCGYCMEEHHRWCDECCSWVNPDNYNDDANMCETCVENTGWHPDLIGSYHSHKYIKFGKCDTRWNGKWRGIGIELEIDDEDASEEQNEDLAYTLSQIAGDRIYFENDGSLDEGFEIITHPHTLKEFEKIPFDKILESCRQAGYNSHNTSTCGLHIHVSRNFFGSTENQQYNNIAKLLAFYEVNFDEFLKLSRRTESQWQRWANRYYRTRHEDVLEIVKDGTFRRDRYHAVNLSNRETIEFRLGRGTLLIDRFNAWIDIHVALAKNAKCIHWNGTDLFDPKKWLKGIKPETIAYIKEKNAFPEVF